MEWFSAGTAVRASTTLWQHKERIHKWWKSLLAYYNLGRTQIVVTGHSSVGKTALVAQMLTSGKTLFFEQPEESIKTDVEAIVLHRWAKIVRVLPGQIGRRTDDEVEAFQNNPSLEGVIHVTDFGHVVPRDPVIARARLRDDGLDTLEKLRKANLDSEIQALSEVLQNIRLARSRFSGPKWLVIAVNKVDLYPDRIEEALDWYHPSGTSEFAKRLREFQAMLGGSTFGIYVVRSSVNATPLEWNQDTRTCQYTALEQGNVVKELMNSLAVIGASLK
jgi:hypothetical protein